MGATHVRPVHGERKRCRDDVMVGCHAAEWSWRTAPLSLGNTGACKGAGCGAAFF